MRSWLALISRLAAAAFLSGSILVALPQPASAAIITVTTTDDEFNTGASCSLREAIVAANTDTATGGCTAGSGPDTIALPNGTYALDEVGRKENAAVTGDLDITQDLTIQPSGTGAPTIDANDIDRVFEIHDVAVTMVGLSIVDGFADGASDDSGGGILNRFGDLILQRVRVDSNKATFGGGIQAFTGATTTLIESSLTFNTATASVGGMYNYNSTASLTRTIVANNQANFQGAGVFTAEGTLTVTDSWIHNNISDVDLNGTGPGGGLEVFSGTAVVRNTTISDNTAVQGDGISVQNGDLTLTNSTLSSNGTLTSGGQGGGIWNLANGDVTITNSTFEANVASSTAGTGGNIYNEGTMTARNVLVGDDAGGGNCGGTDPVPVGPNLEEGAGDLCGFTKVADVLIGPLQVNGGPGLQGGVGPPRTHALLAGSPAVNAGSGGPATDQRGVPRPQGPAPDVGAYERAFCQGVLVNEVGTEGDDSITAETTDDGVLALGGDDLVHGLEGDDHICGGAGDDELWGGDPFTVGDGQDLLLGAGGNDTLRGGDAADDLQGGGGGDQLLGGAGADDASGGAGADNVVGNAGNDDLFGNDGPDKLAGGPDKDDCNGGPGTDSSTGCETKTGIP